MIRILPGDCCEVLAGLEADSFAACCTDPPYHLTAEKRGGTGIASLNVNSPAGRSRISTGFLGTAWDGGDVAFRPETWAAVLRVLKPGAYLAAFGGTRRFHRLVCAIEDAGFEIRDTVSYLRDGGLPGPLLWAYGSGFPKSRNVSKDLADERCLCNLRSDFAEVPTFVGADILQHEVRGDSEENAASGPHLPGLCRGVAASNALSGGMGQDVLASLCGTGDFASPNRADQANRDQEAGEDGLPDLHGRVCASAGMGPHDELGSLLQPLLPREGSAERKAGDNRADGNRQHDAREQGARCRQDAGHEQPGVERRRDVPQEARELHPSPLCEVPVGSPDHGANGRLCDGASTRNGPLGWAATDTAGVRSPHRPQSAEQSGPGELGALAGQPEPQDGGAWPHCGRCGKPMVPDGLGTALKPAVELICIARKPLSESTVASNVLRWGTGALNIDKSRVATIPRSTHSDGNIRGGSFAGGGHQLGGLESAASARWPANLCHDGSPEVLEAFARFGERDSPKPYSRASDGSKMFDGGWSEWTPAENNYGDTGTAARFFFEGKARSWEREGGHPTQKPVKLMEWLVRLVCPPGGAVLDPFAGTGSTLVACDWLGIDATGIELDPKTCADAEHKIKRLLARRMRGDDAPRQEAPSPGQLSLL